MKAAEELRLREEEEEKRKAAERRREEKRLEREVRCTSYFMDVHRKAELGSEYKKRFSHVTPLQNIKNNLTLCFRTERRGETETTEKATGADGTGPPTPPQNVVAAAGPGAMETPHSAQTSQRGGKSPVLSISAVSLQRHREPASTIVFLAVRSKLKTLI